MIFELKVCVNQLIDYCVLTAKPVQRKVPSSKG